MCLLGLNIVTDYLCASKRLRSVTTKDVREKGRLGYLPTCFNLIDCCYAYGSSLFLKLTTAAPLLYSPLPS